MIWSKRWGQQRRQRKKEQRRRHMEERRRSGSGERGRAVAVLRSRRSPTWALCMLKGGSGVVGPTSVRWMRPEAR